MMMTVNYETPRMAMNKWHEDIISKGLGQSLGIDLPSEMSGCIPNAGYYDKEGKEQWNAAPRPIDPPRMTEIPLNPLDVLLF